MALRRHKHLQATYGSQFGEPAGKLFALDLGISVLLLLSGVNKKVKLSTLKPMKLVVRTKTNNNALCVQQRALTLFPETDVRFKSMFQSTVI